MTGVGELVTTYYHCPLSWMAGCMRNQRAVQKLTDYIDETWLRYPKDALNTTSSILTPPITLEVGFVVGALGVH